MPVGVNTDRAPKPGRDEEPNVRAQIILIVLYVLAWVFSLVWGHKMLQRSLRDYATQLTAPQRSQPADEVRSPRMKWGAGGEIGQADEDVVLQPRVRAAGSGLMADCLRRLRTDGGTSRPREPLRSRSTGRKDHWRMSCVDLVIFHVLPIRLPPEIGSSPRRASDPAFGCEGNPDV